MRRLRLSSLAGRPGSRMLPAFVVLVSVAAFVATGCGGPSKESLAEERSSYVGPLQDAVQLRDLATAKRAAARREEKCRKRIGGFVSALRDLDSVLQVGVTLNGYSDELARVRVQYDRVGGASGLDSDCSRAALSAESAMNVHTLAYNNWRDCVAGEGDWSFARDAYGYSDCEFDWIEGPMQSNWRSTSKDTDRARRRLDAIGTKYERPPMASTQLPVNDYTVAGTVYDKAFQVFCQTDVRLDAQEPCTELESVLEEGVSDEELDDLNDALQGLTTAYGITPKTEPAKESAS